MRTGHGAKGRLAGRAAVHLPSHGTSNRRVVLGRELHEQIVRMLPIVNLLSVALLASARRKRRALLITDTKLNVMATLGSTDRSHSR